MTIQIDSDDVNSRHLKNIEFITKTTPSLGLLTASLQPFSDVINTYQAGVTDDGEEYLIIGIDDINQTVIVNSIITAKDVTITYEYNNGTFEETMTDIFTLWEYLRQLPRQAGSFFGKRPIYYGQDENGHNPSPRLHRLHLAQVLPFNKNK